MPPETRSKRSRSTSNAEPQAKQSKRARNDPKAAAAAAAGEAPAGTTKARAGSSSGLGNKAAGSAAQPPQVQEHQPAQGTRTRRGRAAQRAAPPAPPAPASGTCPATEASVLPAAPLDPPPPVARADGAAAGTAPGANPGQAQMDNRGGQDDDQDPGGHPFGRDFSSASSALQGLLKKLGAGFEDILPGVMGMGGSKMKAIITGLRAYEDEGQQLSSLSELCEFLSIASEDALASFPLETVVPLLVQLLNMEHQPDIMLLAARAMTFMADALPTSCGAIARHGAIPVFCARLLTIEYIDLAEQSLQALEKLSHDYSHVLLQHGGLLAVLSFLDFFPTGVQRIAVMTAANMCRALTLDNADAAKSAVPILTSLLQYSDSKVVDNACIALSHIADAFSAHSELLAQLSSGGLITQTLQLISVSDTGTMSSQLSLGTYFSLVKLLTTCVRSSPAVAQSLLQAGVLDTLTQLLATSSMLSTSGAPATSSVVRSVDQLHDVILLLSELLPAIPDAPSALQRGVPLAEHEQGALSPATSERQAFLTSHPEVLSRFCSQLLPLLLQVHATTVMPQVRHSCLVAICKVLIVTPADMLGASLKDLTISNFIASLLLSRDTTSAAHAMQMAEVLMVKLPNTFRPFFLKEGVLHAMEQLVAAQAAAAAAAAAAATAATAAAPATQPAAGTSEAAAEPASEPSRVTRSSSRLRESQDKGKDKDKSGREKDSREAKDKEKAEKEAKGEDRDRDRARRGMATFVPAPAELPKAPQAAPKPTLKEALAQRAAQFRQAHFADGSGSALETEGLVLMRRLTERLPQADVAQLGQLFDALAGNSISVFELLNSGAVKDLLSYLTGEDLQGAKGQQEQGSQAGPASKSGAAAGAALPGSKWDHAMLERLHRFAEAALPEGSGGSPALASLVRKLQAALSSLETFPVVSARIGQQGGSRMAAMASYGGRYSSSASAAARSGGGAGASGSLSSGLAMLTQPLKLRLSRHPSERQLREYSFNIVMIEPLATMTAIEDFLYPRVVRSAASPSETEGGAGTAAAAAAAKKAAEATAAAAGAGASKWEAGKAAGKSDAGASGAGGSAAAGRAGRGTQPPAASKAQAIPDSSNRRVTRSQAAKGGADLGGSPSPLPGRSRSRRRDAADKEEGRSAGDEDKKDEEPRGTGPGSDGGPSDMQQDEEEPYEMEDEEGRPIFDDDDEGDGDDGASYDDMEDGGEGDLDIQPMHVHDLHVEEPAGGSGADTAGASGAAAAAAAAARNAGRIAASAAAAAAAAKAEASSSLPAAPAPAADAPAAAAKPGEAQASKPTAASVVGQDGPKLVFYIGDRKLSAGTTVFQAVQQQFVAAALAASGDAADEHEDDADGSAAASQQRRGRRLWDEIHTLSYRRAADVPPDEPAVATTSSSAVDGGGADPWSMSPLSELLRAGQAPAVNAGQQCKDVLQLLQLLEAVNRLGPRVAASLHAPPAPASAPKCARSASAPAKGADSEAAGTPGRLPREEFVNQKLGSKLGQQLKDVLSICGGSMPQWVAQLVRSCKFLFPFEMRRRYFYCTAFGLGRALHHMQQLNAAESGGASATIDPGRELRVGRLQRQKVRVSRKRILESAVKVMELYAKQRAVLEIEYFGEVGTGLGPTLEFFTLLSHDLQKRSLGLWRHEDNVQVDAMDTDEAEKPAGRRGDAPAAIVPRGAEAWHEASEYVNAPWGLFPAPLAAKQRGAGSQVVEHFRLLGRATAKALQDCRLMDLPFNYAFYKAVLGKHVDLLDVSSFDPQLGHTLERMRAAVTAHAASGGDLQIDGVSVTDLCLTFTLPGYPDYELLPGGADMVVEAANLGQYIDAVVDATLGSGIESQLCAFREGFCEVFPLSTLDCFYEDELETLLCGSGEAWTVQSLADSIKFDHGYTGSSPVIKCFLEVLSELDAADRRRFLRFVTGCPRLPPGGIAALQPQLTVVRKHPSSDTTPPGSTPVGSFKDNSGMGTTAADCDLPSVMTCANYIKLPPYSSKEILRQRVIYAISEGQGSFDLS